MGQIRSFLTALTGFNGGGGFLAVVAASMTLLTVEGAAQGLIQHVGDQCDPWQCVNRSGECVDCPGTFYPPGNDDPGARTSCWRVATCMCYNGESPGLHSCSPCSTSGSRLICVRH